jgi:hypothetical protein
MPIRYAVIALKQIHVDAVVAQLTNLGMQGVANWLEQERQTLYGQDMSDWKPFNRQSVDEFLDGEYLGETFYSETPLIDSLRDDLSNMNILVGAEIELFFLDVFALFSDWHQQLALRLDAMIAANRDTKLCLVVPNSISTELTHILTQYGNVWSNVVQGYLLGHFCPLILRADDLTNLRQFIPRLPRLGAMPNQAKGAAVDQRYGTGRKPALG